MTDGPIRYDAFSDSFVPVDQEWVDMVIIRMKEMHHALENAKNGSDNGSGRAQSKVRQEARNSDARGEGVQSGGRGEAEGQEIREVAVAWACTVDGWVSLPHRAIRNPHSTHIVWMAKETWQVLASHADIHGLFYIPCEVAPDAQQLRMMVASRETSDAT